MGNNRIIITTQEDVVVPSTPTLPLEVGIVLEAPRGPVGIPVRVTSEAQLLSVFGTPTPLYPVLDSVRTFIKFYNGVTISRIQYSDAVASSTTLTDGADPAENLVTLSGVSHSNFENDRYVILTDAGDNNVNVNFYNTDDILLETFIAPKISDAFVNEVNFASKYLRATKVEDGIITLGTFTLAGGAKGSLFTHTETMAALQVLDSPFISKLDILAAPGLLATRVTELIETVSTTHMPALAKAVAIAQSRLDTIVLADFPPAYTVSQVNADLQYLANVNNVAYYFPAIKQRLSAGEVVVPASMAAMFVHAAAAATSPWTSPAGFSASYAIPRATGAIVNLTSNQAALLYEPATNIPAVNPIIYDSEFGFVIDGQKTGDIDGSLTRSLAIAKLVRAVETKTNSISKKFQYRPNTETTWDAWKLEMITYLNNVIALAGIDSFQVFMGRNTMTQEEIAEGKLIGIIKIVPVFAVESILITININAAQA